MGWAAGARWRRGQSFVAVGWPAIGAGRTWTPGEDTYLKISVHVKFMFLVKCFLLEVACVSRWSWAAWRWRGMACGVVVFWLPTLCEWFSLENNLVPRVFSLPREGTLVTCLCIQINSAQRVDLWLNFVNTVYGGESCAALQTLFWKLNKLFVRDPGASFPSEL